MTPAEQTHGENAAVDGPLPPYPPNLGHPLSHTVRTMPDILDFRDRAMSIHDLVRIHLLGPGDIYNLAHPDYVERVLVSERDSFRKSADFPVAFGGGLLATEGETWREQRDVLGPLFRRDSVRSYADGMVDHIRRRRGLWSDGDEIDLQAEMQQLTLEVLFGTLFGRELAIGGDEEIRAAAGRLHEWFRPTSYPLPRWIPTPARRRFRRGKRTLKTVASELLDEAAETPTHPADADDLLSLLVSLRESGRVDSAALSDDQLRDQVVTMIFAGHDTTASTLALAFAELSRHPDVCDRFHEEVDRLDAPVSVDDVDDLSVTERIVTETLRLYPPVYVIPRETTRPVEMGGYRIPAGKPAWVSVRQIHRDSRFFDDPKTFDPARWDGDMREQLHDFAYVPFGAGPRYCIGRQFALLEAKLALATIGRRYRLDPVDSSVDDPPLTAEITLRMAPGTMYSVSERTS